jgi:hypothetical protein
MARIRCKYIGCVYLDNGDCTATLINLDPEEGCLTFAQVGDPYDEEWDLENDDEDLDGYDEWDDEEDYGNSLYDDDF